MSGPADVDARLAAALAHLVQATGVSARVRGEEVHAGSAAVRLRARLLPHDTGRCVALQAQALDGVWLEVRRGTEDGDAEEALAIVAAAALPVLLDGLVTRVPGVRRLRSGPRTVHLGPGGGTRLVAAAAAQLRRTAARWDLVDLRLGGGERVVALLAPADGARHAAEIARTVALLAEPAVEEAVHVVGALEQGGVAPARAEQLAAFVPEAIAHAALAELGVRPPEVFAIADGAGTPGPSRRLQAVAAFGQARALAEWLLEHPVHGPRARVAAGFSSAAAAVGEALDTGRAPEDLRIGDLVLFLVHPLD